MKVLSIAMCAVVLTIAGTACTKSTDTSASGSSATSASDATATGPAAASAAAQSGSSSSSGSAGGSSSSSSVGGTSGGAATDEKTGLPLYPGATSQASAASNGEAGTVLSTDDSFDKVYAWYKSKMPAGSEKAKLSAGGMSTATFQIDQKGGKGTVAITSTGTKTTITLAQSTM
jgi:hypothetical protein